MFVCQDCNTKYSTSSRLQGHVKWIHVKKEKKYNHISDYYDKYLKKDFKEGICIVTGEKTTFIGFTQGYRKYLNDKVCHQDPIYLEKVKVNSKKAIKEKYGVDSVFQLEEIKKKAKESTIKNHGGLGFASKSINDKFLETMNKNHGCDYSSQSKEIKEKIDKTVKERYGVDNVSQNEEIKKKARESSAKTFEERGEEIIKKRDKTMLERYGATSTLGSPIIKERIKETNLEKYGVENPMQNDEIQAKMRKSKIEKYGGLGWDSKIINDKIKNTIKERYGIEDDFENISQLKFIRDKITNNLLEKYGVTNVAQVPWVQEKIAENNTLKYGSATYILSEELSIAINKTWYFYKPLIYTLKNNNKIRYQSKAELKFIEYCEYNDIEIEDGITLTYYLKDEKPHKYYVDFKIKEENKWRLIEIKSLHKWFWRDLENGILNLKILTAQIYSKENDLLPYKMIMQTQIKKDKILDPTLLDGLNIVNSALKAED